MIGALTLDGVEAGYLVPVLRPGDLVVMDNLGAHHATGVKEAIRAVGADVLYLPPYSPDLNPIELCWSKVRQRWFRVTLACRSSHTHSTLAK